MKPLLRGPDTPDSPDAHAYATEHGVLNLWCGHCHDWHRHGKCGDPRNAKVCRQAAGIHWAPCTCPIGSGDGWRTAHCYCERSPLRQGYYVVEVGPFTDEIRRSHKTARRGSKCPGAECVQHRADEAERAWRYTFSWGAVRDQVDILGIPCPKCLAEVGAECNISRGHVHAARRYLARGDEENARRNLARR